MDCYSLNFPFRSTLPNIPCNGIRRNRWPRSVPGEVRRQHEWRVTPPRGRTLRHPDSRNQAPTWELVQTQKRGHVHQIPKQRSGPSVFPWPYVWGIEKLWLSFIILELWSPLNLVHDCLLLGLSFAAEYERLRRSVRDISKNRTTVMFTLTERPVWVTARQSSAAKQTSKQSVIKTEYYLHFVDIEPLDQWYSEIDSPYPKIIFLSLIFIPSSACNFDLKKNRILSVHCQSTV